MIRAALVLGLLAAPAQADTFVLVHGAWVGEWAWDGVIARLTEAGHTAIAVPLTGLGTRAAEASAEIRVSDHIADIVAVIEAQDTLVILVAHSWGGRPATGAWDAARDRIAHVVLVEAAGPVGDASPALRYDARSIEYLMIFQPDTVSSGLLAPPPTIEEVAGHTLTPMSLLTLYAEVPLLHGPLPATPGTFVWGEDSDLPVMRQYGDYLHERRGWDVIGIAGGHNLPETNPDGLAEILLQLAG